MIELGPGADLFRMFGAFLWIALFSAIIAALWIPHSWFGKLVGLSLVIGFFVLLPGRSAWLQKQHIDAFKAQSAQAWAHFEERCKSSGEFIHRTVDGVEGLFVGENLSWSGRDLRDANAQNIYNRDLSGDGYIKSFLAGRNSEGKGMVSSYIDLAVQPLTNRHGRPEPQSVTRPGYLWVEAIDLKDGQRYRYTGEWEMRAMDPEKWTLYQREFKQKPAQPTDIRLAVRLHPPGDPPPRYAGELVLSFRSTEFIDDAVRDNQATNQMEIMAHGWAFGQIADMENWYAHLRSAQLIPDGAAFTVTGYSLGGHLATAFNLLHQDEGNIAATYTLNGAGVGVIDWAFSAQETGTKLKEIITRFDRMRKNASGTEITFSDSKIQAFYESIQDGLNSGQRSTLAMFDELAAIPDALCAPHFAGHASHTPATGAPQCSN